MTKQFELKRCGACKLHAPNPEEDGLTEMCLRFGKELDYEEFGGEEEFELVKLPECTEMGRPAAAKP
jgi:hypothetical protein